MDIWSLERQVLGITDEQVAVRAFEIFMGRIERNKTPTHGRDVEDWLLAEQQLITEVMQSDKSWVEDLYTEGSDMLEEVKW